MIRKFICLLISLYLMILGCSEYNTTSPGNEEYDIVWKKVNSPIYIDSCFVVPAGQTLKIEPGVEVRFKSSSNYEDFDYDSLKVGMLHIKGNIIAEGTENDSILFTQNGTRRWGIICIDSTTAHTNRFKHCKISHSGRIYNFYNACDFLGRQDIGSIFFYHSSGIIKYCKFENNYCGVFCYKSFNSNITNNYFIDNEIDVFCEDNSTPNILENSFENFMGGCDTWYTGIRCHNSSPTIVNNSIKGYTYAIYCYENCNPEIKNNTIRNNAIGILCEDNFNGIILNNTITYTQYAIACALDSSPHIINNIIANNERGIICAGNSNPYIINNSITTLLELKETGPHGICCGGNSSPVIVNTIIKGYEDNLLIDDSGNHPIISYSLIQSDSLPPEFENAGNNILNLDPLFVDEENENFQLQESSPCINSGNNNIEHLPQTDILGNPRISGNIIDMGAYEFQE